MTDATARHQRLRTLFEEALAHEPSTRGHYLDGSCSDDGELRRQVEHLLAAHVRARTFLERRPVLLRSLIEGLEPSAGDAWSGDVEAAFTGTDRFTVVRTLGVGGMGVVYEAHDNVRDEAVALKTIRRESSNDVYRLKREFRSLADVAHPNLVCLYELCVEDARCFFTMELVRGVSFVEYARGEEEASARTGRLIAAFEQLVDGVAALHRAGKLHRDIKPSNVLVTAAGRVVILDFGLTTELAPRRIGAADAVTGGTPAYLSPEEAAGVAPSEASDWYSVGATLYEALTGDVPIPGAPADVLRRKPHVDPPSPAAIAPDVPASIADACMGLLRRNPKERLSGSDALRVARGTTLEKPIDASVDARRETAFVGRARPLELLQSMFERSKRGHNAAVHVSGVSGIGKSALVHAFIERLAAQEPIVVLHGRCYDHESVPYKALDGVVDSLSRHLCSLSRSDADALLPTDIASLSRLFPVLLQAGGVDDARRRQGDGPFDPIALRQQAQSALRLLLGRIAAVAPLVISIDDLQWTDADSITLLEELLRPPSVPALFVLCSRRESLADSPLLSTLLERVGAEMTTMALEPMNEHESSALIRSVVMTRAALDSGDESAIVEEAGGNPFLIEQLARHVAAGHGHAGRRPTFADAFDQQLRMLPIDCRRFLETLAVCGRPVSPAVVAEASTLASDLRPLLGMLRSAHFIRSSGSPERIEAYHDRIRETLAGGVPASDLRAIHGRLAEVLTARHVDEPEALSEHCLGAGDRARAAIHAGAAAQRAAEALAFDRAAAYYRRALELSEEVADRRRWQTALAAALANAGRPPDAADAFLAAIDGADPAERVELRRRAAEQLLIGGHIDRGLAVIGDVLDEVDMRLAQGPRAALASLVYRRARLRWRGLDFIARPADAAPPGELLRVDTCWSVMTGLATVDMIRACDFSTRHVLLALAAGEPYRVARGLAVEAAFSSMTGSRGAARAAQLLEQARSLADRVDRPHTTALAALTAGMAALAVGRWRDCAARCEEALAILRDRCTGVTWELNAAQNFLLGALLYLGELGDVSRRVPPLLADARGRGNLYVETELCTRMNLVWLAADQPDEGERLAVASIARWSQQGFHRQHYSAALARIQTELYRGDAGAAWALCEECRPALRRTLLLRAQLVRIEFANLRARCALAMASAAGSPRRFLAVARREADRIAREPVAWSNPIAALLNAGVASVEDNAAASATRLVAAIDGFDRAGMRLYAAAARGRLGALFSDDRAQEARRRSDEFMATENVRNPAFMTRMLAPGFRP